MGEIIRNFGEINKNDSGLAGGKGASLGEMTQTNIPVPPGFVILTPAFERFLEETDLNVEVDSILHSVNRKAIHTIDKASEEIKALILGAEMPQDITLEIQKSFNGLGSKYVAVRSSATAEDSASAAWAGQLESYLNITEENLLESVKKCWASLFTPRAIFYRFEKNLHKQKISVAVVVQKMVESEKSGIAFSVHPVTQDYNQLIIEAGLGLGEAIVSGQITPDSYVVEKEPRRIIDKNIQTQTKGLCCTEGGGSDWAEIPKEQGEKQVLSEKEILELSELILKIENHYGTPQDIEWAYEDGKFYIVQSRPITTISKIETTQAYHKIMTRPLSLIDCECWDIGERIKLPEKFKNLLFFDPLFICNPKKAVAVYYNFTDPKQNLQPLIDYLEDNLSWLKKEKIKFDKNCQKIRNLIKNNSADFKKIAELNHEIWPMVAVANVLGSTEFYKVSEKIRKICIQIRHESDDVLHSSLTHLNKLIFKKTEGKQNVLLEEIVNNNLPNDMELKKRKGGWAYHKGNIIFNTEKYLKDNKIQIIDPVKKHDGSVIAGKATCVGLVKGKAKVIFKLSELSKIQKGDVLVTPMTTPEMIPALNKAVAIITDEGGITCHAAIISRELRIPCVIGTINATQLISDGDLVEVNANDGFIRIIKKTEENKPITMISKASPIESLPNQLKDFFERPSSVHIFTRPYSLVMILALYDAYKFKYKNETGEEITDVLISARLQEGVSFYEFIVDFNDYNSKIHKLINQKDYKLAHEGISLYYQRINEFRGFKNKKIYSENEKEKIFDLASRTLAFESLLFIIPLLDHDLGMEIKDKTLLEKAIKARLDTEKFFEPGGELDSKLNELNYVPQYLKGHQKDKSEFLIFNNEFFYNKDILKLYNELISLKRATGGTVKELSGTPAYSGKVTGTAKVILSKKDFDKIKEGDIIIAYSTTPDYLPIIKKCKGIVADEGGILSHASIVGREFKIPCLVGTSIATKIIQDGKKVTLDADNGKVIIHD